MTHKKILVINPNTSADMTATIAAAAQAAAQCDTHVDVITNTAGPRSIEGFFDEILSTASLLEILIREEHNYDAFIIACFSAHPAVIAGKEAISKPVIGIFESSCLLACLLGSRFGIVTTSARWEPLLDEGVRQIGLESRCAGVISSGLSVLDLDEKSAQEVEDMLLQASRKIVQEKGAEVLCLGCAGMAGLSEKLTCQLHIPVIDPVASAVKMAEALVYQNLTTSKTGAYRPVDPRETIGLSPVLAGVYEGRSCQAPDSSL